MSTRFSVACVQNCASDDRESTVAASEALVREAAGRAQLICLPEFFSCLALRERRLVRAESFRSQRFHGPGRREII